MVVDVDVVVVEHEVIGEVEVEENRRVEDWGKMSVIRIRVRVRILLREAGHWERETELV